MKRQTYKQRLKEDLKFSKELFSRLELQPVSFKDLKPFELLPESDWVLEDYYPVKVFNSWQEKLLDMTEEAEVETLEKTSKIARDILKALPLKERTQKEKLFRDHLKTLSEFSNVI